MNNILTHKNETYLLASTVFAANSDTRRSAQKEMLYQRIRFLLSNKESSEIVEAINIATEKGQVDIVLVIEDVSLSVVNRMTVVDQDTLEKYESFLFVIPICINGYGDKILIPKFQTLEAEIQSLLMDSELIQDGFAVELMPTIMTEETISNNKLSGWYLLHDEYLRKRNDRKRKRIYNKNVFYKAEEKSPKLIYLAGVIIKKHISDEEVSPPNIFLGEEFTSQNELNIYHKKLVNYFTSKNELPEDIKNNQEEVEALTVIGLEQVGPIIMEAVHKKQMKEVNFFVEKHKNNDQKNFIILTIKDHSKLVLMVWDNKNDKIIDKILIHGLAVTSEYNMDLVMGIISQTDTVTYVGDEVINLAVIYDNDFSFKQYMEEYKTEKFIPEYVDDNDFGFYE